MPRRKRKKAEWEDRICPLSGENCSGPDCMLWDSYYQRCLIASALIAIKFLGHRPKTSEKEG